MKTFLKILLSSCLIVSFVVDAGLIRRAGRGNISANSATIVLLVPESSIGSSTGLILSSVFYDYSSYNEVVMESGSERIYTVPDYCYTLVGDAAQLADYNDPCYWQFEKGEQLQLFGFLDHLFEETLKETFWTITSTSFNQLFYAPEVSSIPRDDGTNQADIFLNAAMPTNMEVGEYEVFANFKQTAPDGFVFYQYYFVDQQEFCVQVGPDASDQECVIPGEVLGTVFENRSVATRLNVVNANQVDTPSTVALLLTGLLLIVVRRRQV